MNFGKFKWSIKLIIGEYLNFRILINLVFGKRVFTFTVFRLFEFRKVFSKAYKKNQKISSNVVFKFSFWFCMRVHYIFCFCLQYGFRVYCTLFKFLTSPFTNIMHHLPAWYCTMRHSYGEKRETKNSTMLTPM